MQKYFLYVLFYMPSLLFGQVNILESTDIIFKVKQKIIMENGIERLLNKSLEINERKGGINGFCIQIYNGQSREKAQQIKYKFIKLFPKITSVTYERINPNWKVRVGKLRTKLEAQKLQNIIKEKFPNCFLSEIIVEIGEFN